MRSALAFCWRGASGATCTKREVTAFNAGSHPKPGYREGVAEVPASFCFVPASEAVG
jgi:hypothetical protein